MPPTISLEAGMPIVNRIREILLSHPEVITVVSQHGRPDNGSDASGFFNAEFFVPLKPFEEWPAGSTKEKLVETLQGEVRSGVRRDRLQFLAIHPGQHRGGPVGSQRRQFGQDHRSGPRQARRNLRAASCTRWIRSPASTDLGIFRVLGQPNLNITPDRERAARYGLNPGDVNAVVQAALGGTVATTQLEADRQFNVTVRLAPEFRGAIDSVGNIKVGFATPAGNNAYIPLSEIADITLDTGASYIFHERNARFIPIKFSVRGRDLGSTVAEAQQRIARKHPPVPAERIPHRMGRRVR